MDRQNLPSPQEAVELLRSGNLRYVEGRLEHPRISPERRISTASEGQQPFAAVVACSDSRVPVELIFDQGIGDLFVIRIAGNICSPCVIGSVEYAIHHLQTPLCLILGHSLCGAVTAVATGAELHGMISALAGYIRSAVDEVTNSAQDLDAGELVSAAVEANVRQAIADLMRGSAITREHVGAGVLMVAGAVYDIESGAVEWLGTHPDQEKLLSS